MNCKGKAHIFECLVIREWGYLRRIRRYGLVGGNVFLGAGFDVSKVQASPRVLLFLLSMDPEVKSQFLFPHHIFLPAAKLPTILSFIRVAMDTMSLHSNRTLTMTLVK